MKVTCDREALLAAFQTAAAVAPTRSPKPILQNVKLEVTEKSAIMLATDLEVGIRIQVPGIEVQVPRQRDSADRLGSARSCAKAPTNACSSKPTARARWSAASGASSSCRPKTRTSFRPWPTSPKRKYHELPARLLHELIRRTVFATDNESSRYALGGVLLELAADKIIGVGTDGRRLAKMEVPGHERRRASVGRQHDDRADQGHAADRAGADRSATPKFRSPPGPTKCWCEPAGHDLLAAGRRPFSQVARRVSAAHRRRARSN